MSYSYSKTTGKKLADFVDKMTIKTPVAMNSNKSYDGAERGNGKTTYVQAPDAGTVVAGATITDDTNLSINRNDEKALTLAQNHIALKVGLVDGQLDFLDDDSILGLRAENLASYIHKQVCQNIAVKGATASVAAATYEMKALARGSAIIQALRGGTEMKGAFNPLALPDIMDDSFKKFMPSEQSKKLYADSSLGMYALTDWYQTPDIENFTCSLPTLGSGTALKASATFTNGVATSVTLSVSGGTATLSGTIKAGTPIKLTNVYVVDPLGNSTNVPYVIYPSADVTASSNTATIALTTPMYNAGVFKNVSVSGDLSAVPASFLLTDGKTYARALAYTKATNMFRQAELPSVVGAQVKALGNPSTDIRLKLTIDGDVRNYQSIMRVDTLTAQELAYNQWAHTVFFDITSSY